MHLVFLCYNKKVFTHLVTLLFPIIKCSNTKLYPPCSKPLKCYFPLAIHHVPATMSEEQWLRNRHVLISLDSAVTEILKKWVGQ